VCPLGGGLEGGKDFDRGREKEDLTFTDRLGERKEEKEKKKKKKKAGTRNPLK